ncbi:MAG TPA: universal stress protein [Bacteroidia bacterium]|nr:universal stress protein [Bacteroidia bacterium]
MKNILVPTDFSANAENALTYACELNRKMKTNIKLLHSYSVPVPAGDTLVVPIDDTELKAISLANLTKTRDKIHMQYPDMDLEVQSTMGMAADEIVLIAQETNTELIVMGTHGATGIGAFLLGTNTANVIERTKCAVIAVPENAVFNGLKRIVFAADYGNHNFEQIKHVVEFAKMFGSEIILLHISTGEVEGVFEDMEIARFKEQVISESGYNNVTYRLIEDKDVFHGINQYLEQFKPDMLAISMRSRTLFERMFSRSLTKRLAYQTHTPLLALHIAKK